MADIDRARIEAAKLLKKARGPRAPVDVAKLAEAQGVRIIYQDMEDSISGMLVHDTDATVIAVNARHHANRQRFTIAHELGHHVLHADHPTVFVDNRMVHFRAESLTGGHTWTEVEANAFAAELLMPAPALRRDLGSNALDLFDDEGLRGLADRYQVSTQALTIRLTKLGLVQGVPPEDEK